MAAILGILASCPQELVNFIAEPIMRPFNYFCCFNSNIENLKDEAQKLEHTRSVLQNRVTTEENNLRVIEPRVKTWLAEVVGIQVKKTEIDTEITTFRQNGWFSVKSRFSLGKKVKNTVEDMKKLREEGSEFNIIAHPPLPAAMVSFPLGSPFEFDSRKQIEEEIIVSLKDENVNKLGICGMGGVGKTTMAKRIMGRVREEPLFDEIIMAVVSQKVDKLGIQGVIAKYLGLELQDKENVSCRAPDLHARLTAGTKMTAGTKKSLIVLDDVWEILNLEELGIPCDSGCKILLTSRDRKILERMEVEKVHAVKVLSETEAWDLFKSKAGSCVEQENVIDVAQQVVKECKGLPIALVTVGVALKDAVDIRRWKHALDQLKSANPNHMPEVIEDVYKPLRFSYKSLKSVDEKSLFLLCCLFPEDYDIPLEDLAIYAMGLRMFQDIRSLERAQETVCFLVERLKSCFLLLEGDDENSVKMHDVVRDVAIFIASDEKRIKCDECIWHSPNIGERLQRHVGSAVYPNLRLLLIDSESRVEELEIGDDFFEGMEELNVLSIEYSSLRLLPQTTTLMKNLKTLILVGCGSLESISVVGELVNLEILICRWCESIECLPIEMERLSRLRLLELSGCRNLKTIAPGIISKQKGLEELIVEDFDNWEAADEERERKNASVSEFEHLSSLTRLKIKIKDYRVAAGHKGPSPNMVKYDITIGDDNEMCLYSSEGFEKALKLKLAGNISLGKWIHECVRSVEYMWLEGSGDSSLDFGVAHQHMRSLTLKRCSAVKKLVNMSSSSATVFPLLETLKLEELSELEEICHIDGPMQSNSFQNLKELQLVRLPTLKHLWNSSISPNQQNVISSFNRLSAIYISNCHGLQSLFSLSVMASGSWLVQLESLEIWSCDMMEQVFLWNEEENQTNFHIPLVFPKLKKLELFFLPRLTSFCTGLKSIEFPLLDQMEVVRCPLKSFVFTTSTRSPDDDDDSIHLFHQLDKVKFDCLKVVQLEVLENFNYSQIPIELFGEVHELKLSGFKSLKSLFSLSMTESSCLLQLEKLEISECDMMEQVFLWNEEENQTNIHIPLVFPKLKKLELFFLPRLTSFCKGIKSIEFPLLDQMEVVRCPLKSFVFTTSTRSPDDDDDSIHLFHQPDKVKFDYLKVVRLEILENFNCFQIPIELFGEVRELKLSGFKSLKTLFSLSMTESSCLLQLEKLDIWNCDMMEQVLWWNEEEDQRNNGITLQFPKLKLLKLASLPRLTSFSKGVFQSIEFPLLEEMEVWKCSLLKGLVSSGSSDDHDVSNIHFFSKVKIDRLTKLVADENAEMGRNLHQFPIDLFAGLCELKISAFKDMKSLFSLLMTQSGCCLSQLEKLEIRRCEIMEQIILCNEEESQRNIHIIPFPKLKHLILDSLPRLMSFCKGIESIIEFSLPEKMEIRNCPILLESCVSTSISPTGPPHDNDDSMHLFCKPNKVKFDRLTTLVVGESVDMGRNLHQIPIDLVAGLCQLEVSGFKEMKSLFSLPMTQSGGCLSQLEKLEIRNCEIMEQIILWNEEEKENQRNIHIRPFPKLKHLILDSLPRLTSFSKGIESIVEFSLPEKMEISNCPILLESCVSTSISPIGPPHHNDDSMHLFCQSNKVEFGDLKELSISKYDSMRNWCGQIPINFFAVLCRLEVSMLKGMKSLFPCSIARNLRNIIHLRISGCEEMVKVIEDEDDDDALQISLFPNLKRLDLWCLHKLKSFCEWRCALQLPKLEDLNIIDCDVMDKFTLGALNKPNLKTIGIDSHDSGNEVNKALQQHRLKREKERKTQLEESSPETDSTN